MLESSFDPARALELIERRRITPTMGVPANYLRMAAARRFAEADLAGLRQAVAGGAPVPEPLLRTGDVAERDAEGFHRIRDRLKDMYISGGENVYPAEIEAALHEHPSVVDAAVSAVPDERWGEVGVAIVVLRPGTTADERDLLAHCRARLARFKAPRAAHLAEELQRSTSGELLKGELRARYSPGRSR